MRRSGRSVFSVAAGLLILSGIVSAGVSLAWISDSAEPELAFVRCTGVAPAALAEISAAGWSPRDWQELMPVEVSQTGLGIAVGLPPMAGTYAVTGEEIIFRPLFPLQRGLRYTAVFRSSALPGGTGAGSELVLRAELAFEELKREPTTKVLRVDPGLEVLPENTLKFYLTFSAPMSGGRAYEHVRILSGAGKPVFDPFLEIDQEMWNHAMTRLTLFIDPGRIKRGLAPRADLGPVFEEGKEFTLEIDAAWKDAQRQPLGEGFRRVFRTGPPDDRSPAPADWILTAPPANSREPLRVAFDEPLDHALALRLLTVSAVGRKVRGTPELSDSGDRWSFIPDQPWQAGPHHVNVPSILEDLAGNSVGKPFEVDLFTRADPPDELKEIRVPFSVD